MTQYAYRTYSNTTKTAQDIMLIAGLKAVYIQK
jgi:hypothetical protein